MGWETRGNGSYYYRKVRKGGRVVSEYIGAGGVAEALAGLDELDRRQRQRAAADWRAVVESDRQQAEALAEVDELVKSAVAAVLIANGYHTHKRQWRKMR
ncbi:MAG: hypothetical protein H3C69_08945 [Candidatus Promineofilum sp.]|nr:hypothetical protein [Promineifilum sp.]